MRLIHEIFHLSFTIFKIDEMQNSRPVGSYLEKISEITQIKIRDIV
ncbi:hypothetical protein YEP4_05354 [Yersinia enterocolitica subsp. palearctica YE-P4]|uniref:Uncharacterized protein n=1 Tax=Yersinia enterocolitica subsp. palearctica serotype O:3 (strain DSM 13030 / CIP 106945 / Y11) TaxID=930944 RepID=A0A0H3NPH6_YERE1|nr:hypothetical protein IOK_14875 [Yersinia enterocolitica subsp. palearctica PhRBD_Ye1]EOR68865.1 hypothetical protein YE149_05389 [Yersinia enterocolitica subsp. palearctica YE-149]EOR79044.1 hypothetical protein YEP1_05384 [Yersinia enterocolitica subsp. palearctica YE-P1]EOR79309.1 hypothetical protein YE150_05364 [Yersinia enterocolitica subsp. palearctica YE-150]EOR82956.1 hypothetical protein YEP4_05354 [Yersinia enterocolitica subsp. palearctica YE-P4]CBY27071.1 hypothetical protein Y1